MLEEVYKSSFPNRVEKLMRFGFQEYFQDLFKCSRFSIKLFHPLYARRDQVVNP